MIQSLGDWLSFLNGADPLIGFPMVVGGVALMFFGWRLWKLSVVLVFGLVGLWAGQSVLGENGENLWYALLLAVGLSALSYRFANYAVALLGGLIASSLILRVLSSAGFDGPVFWSAGAVALVCFTGYSFISRRFVVIVVTSGLGALVLLSGLATWVMTSSSLYGSFRTIVGASALVVPFMIIVPTVMSAFYQAAEVHRHQIEI